MIPGYSLYGLVHLAFQAYVVVVFLRVIASWMPPTGPGIWAQVQVACRRLTDPVLMPIRRVLDPYQRSAGMDFSPVVLIVLLMLLERLVVRYLVF